MEAAIKWKPSTEEHRRGNRSTGRQISDVHVPSSVAYFDNPRWPTFVVHYIEKKDADVHRCIDHDDNTALHCACSIGNYRIARRLLARGADPRRRNRHGQTPLAVAFHCNHDHLVHWLVTGVRVDIDRDVLVGVNRLGNTLMKILWQLEADKASLLELADSGAARLNGDGDRLRDGRFVDGFGNGRPYDGVRLLNQAVVNDDVRSAKRLIERGCRDYTRRSLLLIDRAWTETKSAAFARCWRWLYLAGFRPSAIDAAQLSGPRRHDAVRLVEEFDRQPMDLQRLCVHAIRDRLIDVQPAGQGIFNSIDRLPLPSTMHEMLKLRGLTDDDDDGSDEAIFFNEISGLDVSTRPYIPRRRPRRHHPRRDQDAMF